MRLKRRFFSAVGAGALLLGGAACWASAAGTSVPAVWAPYDMIIHLDHLPRQYSCNDLWYKFRDVLQVIGAQRISEILPYDCGDAAAEHGLSPKVHIVFALPDVATGIEARYADSRASRIEVRLAPGQPPRLDDFDCGLVQQINNTLVQAIPLHVVSAHWNCAAPVNSHPRYELTLQVLKPVPSGPHQAGGSGTALAARATS